MGGGKGATISQTPSPPPIFSPLTPVRGTVIPRDAIAASGTSNLHQCVCEDADTSIQTPSGGERNIYQPANNQYISTITLKKTTK